MSRATKLIASDDEDAKDDDLHNFNDFRKMLFHKINT